MRAHKAEKLQDPHVHTHIDNDRKSTCFSQPHLLTLSADTVLKFVKAGQVKGNLPAYLKKKLSRIF